MMAVNPSKKSIIAMIRIRIPLKRIQPAQVSLPAMSKLLSRRTCCAVLRSEPLSCTRKARPPAGHAARVFVVRRAEAAAQGRLLVPVHEGPDGCEEGGGVRHEQPAAEDRRLAEDDRGDREIHRVPDVAVQTADDKLLRRSNRGWSADPLEHESRKRLEQDGRAGDDGEPADHLEPCGR